MKKEDRMGRKELLWLLVVVVLVVMWLLFVAPSTLPALLQSW